MEASWESSRMFLILLNKERISRPRRFVNLKFRTLQKLK